MLCDVIFPAPSAAYVANLLLPVSAVLAIAAEIVVYALFQGSRMSLLRLSAVVLAVNLFSWVVGIVISSLPILPTGLVFQSPGEGWSPSSPRIVPGPHWNTIAAWSFVWACFLSCILEYFALWLFRARLQFRRLGRCVVTANIASYVVIATTVAVYLHIRR
jgi:hypothetical protein